MDEAFLEKARRLRPFYFIVVVWGERYTDFLVNFCIPSLLAPNNIPALANRGRNKFLIATTEEDWARIQQRPIFERLREYVEPVKIAIPPCPEGVSPCVHMGIGHKLATHIAFEDRAYGVLLTPDLMLSDGSVAAVQRHALARTQVVLAAALRFGEEPLFEHLEKLGVVSTGSRLGEIGKPLIVTGRQLVWAGIRSFHSETLRYEWDAPYFSNFPVACWWRVPEEDGIVLHSLSWAPLLLDYSAIERHDTSVMDNWTVDGDYVYRNFGLDGKVHVVQDSDEIMLVSWARLADKEQVLSPNRMFSNKITQRWRKIGVVSITYNHKVFDPLKRRFFLEPVRWHARDLEPGAWSAVEKRALKLLTLAVSLTVPSAESPYAVVGAFTRGMEKLLHRVILPTLRLAWRAQHIVNYYWTGRRRVLELARRAMKGDPNARRRARHSLRRMWRFLIGKPPA